MTQIGPFFYIRGKLIYNACSLVEGREQAGKLDNPYGHDQLMTIISKAESTLITLVEGFYGTSKRIAQSFTLTLVYIVTRFYLRS